MTHQWPRGEPITVRTNTLGLPRQFMIKGYLHNIEWIVDQWKINTDWWEPWGRIWRDYYLVAADDMFVIYFDWQLKHWFLSDYYD
jgi:hypothetical protein